MKPTITRLKWRGGAADALIKRQRQLHVAVLLSAVAAAGDNGASSDELRTAAEERLAQLNDAQATKRWEKCSLNQHLTWLARKFGDYVESDVELPAAKRRAPTTPAQPATPQRPIATDINELADEVMQELEQNDDENTTS